jgi:hypothetical protein
MKLTFHLLLLLLVVLPILGFAQQTQPITPQQQLAGMKIEMTEASFLTFVAKGDLKTVQLFLDAGMKVDALNPDDDRTALMIAIDKDQTDIANLLISKGADVNASDDDSISPLILAAGKGNLDLVKLLLDKNAAVDASDDDDNTALMAAVRSGKADVVQVLVDRGADPAYTNDDDESAISIAKDKGLKDIFVILKKAKKKS